MTTEEFYGHFMALLHGPNAGDVAKAVATALATSADAKPIVTAFTLGVFEGTLGDSSMADKRLLRIEVAIMAGENRRNEDMRETMRRVSLRVGVIRDIRAAFYERSTDVEPTPETLRVLKTLGFDPPQEPDKN